MKLNTLLALFLILPLFMSLNVIVPAQGEECFFETVSKGHTVHGSFFVYGSGEIDVKVFLFRFFYYNYIGI